MAITLGNTAPAGYAAQAGNTGRIFTQDVTLAGAASGSYFSEIRLRLKNEGASSISCRAVVYSGTTLVDWAAFTLPASATEQVFTVPLTGAVPVTNGTYKIGLQMAATNCTCYIVSSGGTVSFTSTTTFGAAPPNPWTPGSTFSWLLAVAATVTEPVTAPVAAFSGTPLTGDAPLNVTFTDASTNTPTGWAWTFGDGGTSTSQNPSHNYTVAGTYNVQLTATNAGGSDAELKTGYVTVNVPADPLDYAEGGGITIA